MSRITIGLVGILALALVVGMGYIVMRPESVAAHGGGRGQSGDVAAATHASGRGQGDVTREPLGRNANTPVEHDASEMETIRGIVVASGSEIVVRTEAGDDVLVGLGQAWYREQAGFTVTEGDQVHVVGFHEDGEFKAAVVENVTTDAAITLRDTTGRPAWAGQGNRRNSRP